ncbi:MAG: DUF6455 family protein [Pseudolabrys sp.]
MQSAPFQSVSAWLRNVFAVRALPHDLEEGGELSRIAHDLGLTESELKMLARKGPQSPQLLYDRLRELGLDRQDLAKAGPAVMRDLEHTCAMCHSQRRCAKDLARHDVEAGRTYCGNETTLQELKADKAHQASCP